MPVAMRYQNPEVQQQLAQRYVMGTLSDAATRRLETLRTTIPELDKRLRDWDEHLQPMADVVPAMEPSSKLWKQIDASINPQKPSWLQSLWNSVQFVRGIAVAASVAAFAFALLLTTPEAPSGVDYVAVLAGNDGTPQFVATAVEENKQFDLRMLGEPPEPDTDYQLWALSRTDGEARSLGLLDPGAPSVRTLSESDWRLITDAQELLVTVEMQGGSPIGEPSDDVISRGLCLRLSPS